MNEAFDAAWDKIKNAQNITILTHKDADGDTLGSAFGLKSALVSIGKNAEVWCEETKPHKLFSIIKGAGSAPPDSSTDLAITVDAADLGRLGSRAEFFESMGENTIAFDHHKTFNYFAGVNFVDPSAGATAEIVYQFLKYCGIEITPDTAYNLYIGISSDTGGFRQSNTTSQSMRIGADLMDAGANHGEINTSLFLSNTLAHTHLVSIALDTLQTFHNDEIAILYLTREMINKFDIMEEETEGLVNFPRNIIGVKIAFFLKEKVREDGTSFIKISSRSNADKYDVAKLCEHFSGGGHVRAAGGEFPYNDMQRAIKELSEKTISFIEEVDKFPSLGGVAGEA